MKLISPNQQDVSEILKRILQGLEKHEQSSQKYINKMHDNYQQRIKNLETELKSTKDEFCLFQQKNNLDDYFSKNLNDETRKRVLKEVEELSNSTEFIVIDHSVIEKLNEANVIGVLDPIVSEYNNFIKARIEMLSQSLTEDEKNK